MTLTTEDLDRVYDPAYRDSYNASKKTILDDSDAHMAGLNAVAAAVRADTLASLPWWMTHLPDGWTLGAEPKYNMSPDGVWIAWTGNLSGTFEERSAGSRDEAIANALRAALGKEGTE